MTPVVECVPNVSEGRNEAAVAAMAAAVAAVPGVWLLGTDANPDANRTVFTFAGDPDAVAQAACALYATALETIDMRRHTGVHVRNGAVDVCPFVPVSDVSMDTCVALAEKVARFAGDMGIPAYLYGAAARTPQRAALAFLRKGQYEALAHRLRDPAYKPDFGPDHMTETAARFGATQVGARPFLIAYNVSLRTDDVRLARRIARTVRTSGHPRTGVPGQLAALAADGWYMAQYGCAQVTTNVLDFRTTGLYIVYDRIRALARRWGSDVLGSEIVGLVPLEALLDAADAAGCPPDAPPKERIAAARDALMLDANRPFDPERQIFSYVLDRARRRPQGG